MPLNLDTETEIDFGQNYHNSVGKYISTANNKLWEMRFWQEISVYTTTTSSPFQHTGCCFTLPLTVMQMYDYHLYDNLAACTMYDSAFTIILSNLQEVSHSNDHTAPT